MADIKIQKSHDLGLDVARALARHWVDGGARQLGLHCEVVEGDTEDVISFERMGAQGLVKVRADAVDIEVKLGMMLSAFKPMVEAEIDKNLDRAVARAKGLPGTA